MKKKFIKFLKEYKVYSEFRKITRFNGRLILPNFDESVKSYARCGDILNIFNLRDSFGNYLWQLWELEYNKNQKPLYNNPFDYSYFSANTDHYFKCHDGYYDSSIVNGVYLSPPSGKLFYNTFDFKTS
jgi:hypothetical protein